MLKSCREEISDQMHLHVIPTINGIDDLRVHSTKNDDKNIFQCGVIKVLKYLAQP